MEQSTIDIKYSELFKWLEERYLIPKDWPQRLEAAKLKMEELVKLVDAKDSKEFEKIKQTFLPNGPHFGYDEMVKLDKQLSKTEEGKQKNFIGWYSADFMKLSQLILAIFEKQKAFLADYSSSVVQAVAFELPSLTKSVNFSKRTREELESKIKDKEKRIERIKSDKQQFFVNNSIKPSEEIHVITEQLADRLTTLEQLFSATSAKLKSSLIKRAFSYYITFFESLTGNKGDDFLSVLKKANIVGNYDHSTGREITDYSPLKLKIKKLRDKFSTSNYLENCYDLTGK